MTCSCGCSGDRVHLTANFAGHARRETFKSRDHIVVPVVMLRQTVVNGAFVPKDQLRPEAWNGTPVTLNHPMANGQTITANMPAVLEQWQIGTVFNCAVKGDRLTGEAWVDVELAEQAHPGIVAQLEQGAPMDVSTGYFPTAQPIKGTYNKKPYTQVHRELKPDHLALLPEQEGACSWADGCGVRVNNRSHPPMSENTDPEANQARGILAALGLSSLLPKANARGSNDDRRQIVADLVSNDDTPFVPDDMYSLTELSQDTLVALRDKYLPAPATNETSKGASTVADYNQGKAAAPATNTAPRVSDMSVEDFTALVANTATTAANTAVQTALEANRRTELTAQIVANESLGLTAEEVAGMPVTALEKLVANAAAKPAAPAKQVTTNYGGRALATNADDGSNVTRYPGMVNNNAAAKAAAEKQE